MLVTIVDADALALKHQAISINNTDSVTISQDQLHKKNHFSYWKISPITVDLTRMEGYQYSSPSDATADMPYYFSLYDILL